MPTSTQASNTTDAADGEEDDTPQDKDGTPTDFLLMLNGYFELFEYSPLGGGDGFLFVEKGGKFRWAGQS